MKKLEILFFAWVISGSMFLSSCERPAQEEDTTTETAMVSDSREERVSPLRNIQGTINQNEVKVQYGAPSVKNRIIWGDMVPYDEVWRTGANEATNIEFSEDVNVEGKPLRAGRYSIFTIPRQKGPWTIIFNSDWDLEHGHFQYKEENDVLRVEVNPIKGQEHQEQLVVTVEDPGIIIRWEQIELPIKIN
ncbi:DUF2911 domain-containing protein [Anditalea andensis]|uniref:DUF2911 domain-containing protein n=1 Tax=Anditalea andensis TaxID=1048983 RepID=A0A074L1Z9_9BACT|nr:DUF2911 domain-containing protein [Anditalea andensis]KEO74510.1 hypothetical protein EL17_07170 [Anditalea andensis]